MRIIFELIRANSGSDVWTYNLSQELNRIGIETKINIYPHHYQYYPHLIRNKSAFKKGDCVHTNSWNGFTFKREGIPLVVTEHLVVHDSNLNPYKSISQKIFHSLIFLYETQSFQQADMITTISNNMQEAVKQIFKKDSELIYNGIDHNFFKPSTPNRNLPGIDKNKINIIFVGNFIKRKGVDLLPKIKEKLGNNFQITAISGLREVHEHKYKEIFFVVKPTKEKLLAYYNSCDIFLFPSRLEGFGLTILEAMACGKPVVATNCSSLPELITNEKGGYLCEKDNIEEFVSKIRILAQNPGLRKSQGAFNRHLAEENFTLEQMAKKYRALYTKLLDQ